MTLRDSIHRRCALLLTVCLAILSGSLLAQPSPTISKNDALRVRRMLKDVYEAVKKNYYDRNLHGLDWDARYGEYNDRISKAPSLSAGLGLVAGFVDGLQDSHTYFAPPNWSKRVEYGYHVGIVGEEPFILNVTPGSDAAAKLHPGDLVLSINGNRVSRESFSRMQYILNMLTPQVATEVAVRAPDSTERKELVQSKVIEGRAMMVLGGSETSQILGDIERDMEAAKYAIRQRSAELGDALIWKMPSFLAEDGEIDRVVSQARKHRTLILDLRGNPGGYVVALQRLVGSLFERDTFVATRVTRAGRSQLMARTRGTNAFTGRLIVLVDSSSGSSAEMFARIIQLEHRGEIIGDRSAGAVMESRLFPFTQGNGVFLTYAASITSADVLMVDGVSLERRGVTPDTVLLPTAEDLAAGRDPVLSRAAGMAGIALDPIAAAKLFQDER